MLSETLKQAILTILKGKPIRRAALFGSFARGDERPDSDIDLLIEYSSPHSLFDILKLESELSKATTHKIDIVEYTAIKPSMRDRILTQAIPLL